MRRRAVRSGTTAALVSVAMLACASVAAAKTTATPASTGVGVLIPAHKGQVLPMHGGTTSSLNWSGYAVTPGSGITGVTSTFTVPSAGLDPPGFAATWAGIGGYNTSDLIQAGTGEQSVPSNPLVGPQYYAWYELLPNSETQLTNCSGDSSCTVTPGDSITVAINNVSGDTWSISVSDSGKRSWGQDVTYSSSESSAEWILEAPTLVEQTVLANVGTVPFGPTSTYTDASGTHTIAAGSPTQIDLGTGVVNEATPSALASDGQSFNDCSYALSCPTP
jgi:Peptidase A4 family